MGRDYATVHRGVYARSADMTLAHEAARRRIAAFIGARENELAFVRWASEAINLVTYCPQKKGRVLLSTLGNTTTIMPCQLAGRTVTLGPLPADRRTTPARHQQP